MDHVIAEQALRLARDKPVSAFSSVPDHALKTFVTTLVFNDTTGNLAHADYSALVDHAGPEGVQAIMQELEISKDKFDAYSDRACVIVQCSHADNQYCDPGECRPS